MQEFGQSDLTIIFHRLLQDYGKKNSCKSANTKAQTRKLDKNLVKFMGSLKGKIWP